MKICKFFLLLMIFPLMSCSSTGALPTKTTTVIPLTGAITPEATKTPLPLTPTSAPSATSLPLDALAFDKYSCEPILEHLPVGVQLSGTIILGREQNQLALLNAQSSEEQQVDTTDPGYGFFSTSPDGKHLAYIQFPRNSDEKTSWLIIKDINGKQEIKFPNLLGVSARWLDNDHLISSPQFDDNEVALPAIVFNPFTRQKQTIPSKNYPGVTADLSDPATSASGVISSRIVITYDPSLNLAMYSPFDKKLDQAFIVLWNRKTGKRLAQINNGRIGNTTNTIWSSAQKVFYFTAYSQKKSPDGRELGDWFSINAEGEVKQLTYLSDSLEDSSIGKSSLSWDGRHLIFWFNTAYSHQDNSYEYLVVLDLETLKTSAYCVPDADDQSELIWSPDSQYVATTQLNYNGAYPAIVLSIQGGWLAKVAEDSFPKAWWGGNSNVLPVLATP